MLAPTRKPCDTPGAYETVAPARATRWVLPATVFGSSVSYIDESIVNVALPEMQRSLATSFATMQWVFSAYMLTLATLILLGGSIGDRFGRRRIFLLGLGGFGLASIAAGFAPGASWLIGARLAQGAAAALLMPVSLALVGAAFTGEARGRAIGTWAAAGALAIALSRPLGGWLVDAFGWRSIFFVNLPLIGLAMAFGLKLEPDRDEHAEPLDTSGALLAIVSLGLLSYGLIEVGKGDAAGAIAIVGSIPALALFLRREVRAAAPMTPLSLFRNSDFAGVNALTFFYYAGLTGAFFMLPFALIDVHGYSAAAAGAAFLPLSVLMVLGSRWTGGLVERFGARRLLLLGSAVTAAGYVVLALPLDEGRYLTEFLPGLVVVGVGVTLTVAPLTTAVFDAAPRARSGAASGINNAIDVTGGLVAVAALGFAFRGSSASGNADLLAEAYRSVMLAAALLTVLGAAGAALTIKSRGAAAT